MAIIRKNEAMPERPIIMTLFGVPGSGKTSMATTAPNPLLIDTDRGADRAVQRCDTLVAQKWKDVIAEEKSMSGYGTVIIDTAKAMLDDFLADYVIDQDCKLKYNNLKKFGKMAEEFKGFVSHLRTLGCNIVFICHDKEVQDGDAIKHTPDCTGQSKDLLLRLSDQVGYVCVRNGKRCVSFEPTDTIVGKNVARIPVQEIPDVADAAWPTFLSDIMRSILGAIRRKDEAQMAAIALLDDLRARLAAVAGTEDIDALIEACKALPEAHKEPFKAEIRKALGEKGYTYDSTARKFRPKDTATA